MPIRIHRPAAARRRLLRTLLLVAVCLAGPAGFAAEAEQTNPEFGPVVAVQVERTPGYDYFVTGDASGTVAAKTRGGYLMMGGDNIDAAFRWLIEHSGGGRIVVLRASHHDDLHGYLYAQLGGVAAVQSLVFKSRAAASDPRVLDIIRNADGLFIAGGDQANYLRFWQGTPVNELIDAHVRAGKPIGGTSAGLAIQGGYSFGALHDTIDSDEAMRDPFDKRITLAKEFLHWPMLENVITDSHFAERKRLGRLIAFLARLGADPNAPRMTGIGVDESSALCVEADGDARVLSNHADGKVWLVQLSTPAAKLRRGRPLTIAGARVTTLDAGSRFNLRTRTIEQPAERLDARIERGRLSVQAAKD